MVVAGSGQDKFKQGIRNLQRMSITQAKSLSTYAILANRQLIITTEALEEIKRDMLIKAIISEKALKEARNKRYTFVVAVKATKTQIKKWVEKMFGVAVQRVWTTIMPGKVKRRGKKE